MAENKDHQYGSKVSLLVLGGIANILLGFITLYASRLSDDLKTVEAIARNGASSTALLGRDVESLTRWTVEQVREMKERIKQLEQQRK